MSSFKVFQSLAPHRIFLRHGIRVVRSGALSQAVLPPFPSARNMRVGGAIYDPEHLPQPLAAS